MCGIAGVSLSPSSTIPVRQLAHELLLHSEERGKVASGIAWAYGDDHLYMKEPKPGGHLPLRVLPKDARTVFVHTRNATYGDPSDNENNHPVVDDKEQVILVHNGVISNHGNIRLGEKDVAFPEVDSSVIPWLLREQGLPGLTQLDGWAALAWFDRSDPGVMYLARTKGNAPMVVVYLKDGSLVFGSTFPIIHASLIRVGYGDQITGGWEVPEHTTLRVKQGQMLSIGNLEPYRWADSKYKTGPTMTQAEKARLEKITNGDAVGYGKDTPVHAPPAGTGTTTTQPSTSPTRAPGYTSPYSGTQGNHVVKQPDGTYVSRSGTTSYSSGGYASGTDGKAKSEYVPTGDVPKKDPLAGFKAPKTTPPKVTNSTSTWPPPGKSTSSYSPPKPNTTFMADSPPNDEVAERDPLEKLPKRPIPMYLEARLTYWVRYVDDEVEYMPFMAEDWYDDDGYLFNIFVILVEDGLRNGIIREWGVLDKDNVRRFAQGLASWTAEANAYKDIAHQLPSAGAKRSIPAEIADVMKARAALNSRDEDKVDEEIESEMESTAMALFSGSVHQMTDDEWEQAARWM